MAALPYVNTHPVVECRTAQSESVRPQVSEHAISRVEQRRSDATYRATEQADGVGNVRTRLCRTIKERAHERLIGLEQFRRRGRAVLGGDRGFDKSRQVLSGRGVRRMNAGRCAIGHERVHHVSNVRGLRQRDVISRAALRLLRSIAPPSIREGAAERARRGITMLDEQVINVAAKDQLLVRGVRTQCEYAKVRRQLRKAVLQQPWE
eukprot:6172459-Pleurochrysis_carterae.AAC.6